MAVGDITGNGAPDLVFAVNGNNTVWTNDGSGVFSDTGGFVGSGSTYGMALGDLNGDGHLDAFVASAGLFETPWNEVWFNNGSGVFTNSGQTLGNARAFSVALVDVDDDGDLDAVVGNPAGVPNQIWRNNGNGLFTLAPVDFGIANVFDIQSADLDGDGDTDYFLTVNANPSEVWLRVPVAQGGPFKDSGQRIGGRQMVAVAPGDFDGDGSLDIAFGAVGQMVGLLGNNGLGQFQSGPQKLYQGVNIGAMGTLDYNQDGHLDLVVGLDQSFDTNSFNRIWLNNGSGVFSPGPLLPGSRATTSLAVADLTGNGFPDIVEGNRTTAPLPSENPTNQVHINYGAGVWTSMDALGGGWTTSLAVGDLNGDGAPDMVVGNRDIPTTVWFNNGATQFVDSGQALFTNAQDVVLADFNGSGALDLFLVSTPRSVLYTNDGSGAFSVLSSNFFTTAFFMRGATLDLNGNGHMDLWLGFGSVGAVQDRYYLNDGDGNFTGPFMVSKGNNNAALATGDFTGNGVVDLFSAGRNGDSQLWVSDVPMGVVEQYAASFGLSGADLLPFADPDDDGIPNVMEYAYNMNPAFPDAHPISNLASATGGLPFISVAVSNEQPRFIANAIRLVEPEVVGYHLDVAPTLTFTGAVPASVSTTPLDGLYERAVYEYVVPGPTNANFGRFRIDYTP